MSGGTGRSHARRTGAVEGAEGRVRDGTPGMLRDLRAGEG